MWYRFVKDVMGRIRRGGFVFEFWVGDHPPRHVHVFKDGRLVARVELDPDFTAIKGKVTGRIRDTLTALRKEGRLK